MYGYMGRMLAVNLTKEKVSSIPINPEHAQQYLGGSGYACRLVLDRLDFTADPLSPSNILVFMTGPLTGTLAPCTGRHVVCARSPLTGFWGESNSGGQFGAQLKFSGYDGILIEGKSDAPVMISIESGSGDLLRAKHLWGLDTQETQHEIRKDSGRVGIACIGQAGENLVRFSSVVNEERVAARCGMGAVMGSKNLKAITVQGTEKVPISSPKEFNELCHLTSERLRNKQKTLGDEGTATYVDRGMIANDMPVKYFQKPEFDVSGLNARAMKSILTGRKACYACPIACGRVVSLPDYDLEMIAGPEFQTIAAFGTNILNSDIHQIVRANRLCNLYGLDSISCGSTIAFVMQLCEDGFLDWDVRWGDMDSVLQLIREIALRNRRGDELAEGSYRFAKKYGHEDKVLHVKGMEVPNHDPRAYTGLATVYAISARGASHTEADMHTVDIGIDVPCLGIHSSDRLVSKGKGETAAKCQDFRAFHDAMILCHFPEVPPETMVKLLNLAIGSLYIPNDILATGSEIVNLKRSFNLRCGLRPSQDTLPKQLLLPLKDSIIEDSVPDLDMQLEEYYQYRKWNQSYDSSHND
ncbi:MAG: aldehyde ferredoxin oxidoreductase family protein [Candidatus Thorarchaeota archaeon]